MIYLYVIILALHHNQREYYNMPAHEYEKQVFLTFYEKLPETGELAWISVPVIYKKYQSTLANQNLLISKVAVGKLLQSLGLPKKVVPNANKSLSTLYLTDKVFINKEEVI